MSVAVNVHVGVKVKVGVHVGEFAGCVGVFVMARDWVGVAVAQRLVNSASSKYTSWLQSFRPDIYKFI